MVKTTESELQRWINAMPSERYDIRGVWHDKDDTSVAPINRKVGKDKVISLISFLKAENSQGYNIIGRAIDFRYIFIDDLSKAVWDEMIGEGFRPCVVVESSRNNFQAFLDAGEGIDQYTSKAIARAISTRFKLDLGSADAHHMGRVPGFTNRKLKHKDETTGLYPYANLKTASCRICPITSKMRDDKEVLDSAEQFRIEKEIKERKKNNHQSGARARGAENESLRDSDDSTEISHADRVYRQEIQRYYSFYGQDLDRSRADFGAARRMLRRGFSEDSIAHAMMNGEKAIGQSNPYFYAVHTVQKAKDDLCKSVDETQNPSP